MPRDLLTYGTSGFSITPFIYSDPKFIDTSKGAITWNIRKSQKMDLSGGTGGRGNQNTYTAPNGVTVKSSITTYNAPPNYYMEYMFNNSIQTSVNLYNQMFLANGTNGTIIIDFTKYSNYAGVSRIDFYPFARSDCYATITVEISNDNTNWYPVNTFNVPYANASNVGTFFTVNLNQRINYVRFNYSGVNNYMTMDEIVVYEMLGDYISAPPNLNQWYYTYNQPINLSNSEFLNGFQITEEKPSGTDIRYLLSFDGGASFVRYDSGNDTLINTDQKIPINDGTPYQNNIQYNQVNGYLIDKAFDGDFDSYFYNTYTNPVSFKCGKDFGTPVFINGLNVFQDNSYYASTINLFGSNDGTNWTQVGSTNILIPQSFIGAYVSSVNNINTNKPYRYWAFSGSGFPSNYLRIKEIKFYGYNATNGFSTVSSADYGTKGMTLDELLAIPQTTLSTFKNCSVSVMVLMNSYSGNVPKVTNLKLDIIAKSPPTFTGLPGASVFKRNIQQLEISPGPVDKKLTPRYQPGNISIWYQGISVFKANIKILDIFLSNGGTPLRRPTKTYFGIQYGVGWVVTPPFRPRIYPAYWHSAIWNGQKTNDQPQYDPNNITPPTT